jgi:hypothetical protein
MIVGQNPERDEDLDAIEQAWFDSDAPDNATAIREIDAEASKHGLVRTNEYWLQRITLRDGSIVFRGFCYRPQPDYTAERIAKRRSLQPVGSSSADIVRSLRDAE